MKTNEQNSAAGAVGVQQITVSFDDLMALARRLIAEQMDDCDEEFMAGRAHGIGSLHSEILTMAKRGAPARQAPPQGGANPAPPSDQLAIELPTGAPVICKVGAVADAAAQGVASASQSANDLSAADVDQNILSVALWLYRRLDRCYGRPPHIEGPIKALARRVGTDVADCLAERGPDPKAEHEKQEKEGDDAH